MFWGSWYPLVGDPSRAPVHRAPVPRLPGARPRRGSRRPCAAASISSSCATRRSTTTAWSRRRARSAATTRCSSSTTGPTWWRRAAPTACTSARTTRRRREARALSGPDRIVGRSTHAPDAGRGRGRRPRRRLLRRRPGARDADQARPPRRGPALRRARGEHRGKPWFAIGGLDAGNVHEVVERGATRIVVVRAITEADDPERGRARAAGRAVSTRHPPRRARRDPTRARRRQDGLERGYARSRAQADAIRAQLAAARPGRAPARAQARGRARAVHRGRQPRSARPPARRRVARRWRRVRAADGLRSRAGCGRAIYAVVLLFQALLALDDHLLHALAGCSPATSSRCCSCVVVIASARPSSGCSIRVMARLQVPPQ